MRERELLERDIDSYLALQQRKEICRFLTAGSVDDGKSTLIGRLLHDSNTVFDDHMDALRRDSAKRSSAGGEVDYSLLVDGLLSEREQGITIDVAYRYFATEKRKFIIADTPGHEQYTRNMATGASTADLAIILIDARYGILPQTRRHSFIAHLLGIRHIVAAVNKMDLRGYDEAVFDQIRRDYQAFADKLGLRDIHFLPLSALKGDNVVEKSTRMPWYEGPPLLEHLENIPLHRSEDLGDLRFPVQYVLRPNLDFRGFAGTVSSGLIRKGQRIMSLPSRQTSTVSRIVTWDGDQEEAFAPMAVTVTLEDEIDVSRGDMLVCEDALPHVGRSIEAMVVWMHERPLEVGASYLIKHGTQVVSAEVRRIHERVDITTLEGHPAQSLGLNDIGRVTLTAARPLKFDTYTKNKGTGAFILIDRLTNGTFGAGMIQGPGAAETTAIDATGPRGVSLVERSRRLGQKPAVVVLTSEDTAHRDALAYSLERRLWDDGYTAHVVDSHDLLAVPTCQALGLISIVLAGPTSDLSSVTTAVGAEQIVTVSCELGVEGAATVETVVNTLRARETIR